MGEAPELVRLLRHHRPSMDYLNQNITILSQDCNNHPQECKVTKLKRNKELQLSFEINNTVVEDPFSAIDTIVI